MNLLVLPFSPQSFFKHLLCAEYNWGGYRHDHHTALFLGGLQAAGKKDMGVVYQDTQTGKSLEEGGMASWWLLGERGKALCRSGIQSAYKR